MAPRAAPTKPARTMMMPDPGTIAPTTTMASSAAERKMTIPISEGWFATKVVMVSVRSMADHRSRGPARTGRRRDIQFLAVKRKQPTVPKAAGDRSEIPLSHASSSPSESPHPWPRDGRHRRNTRYRAGGKMTTRVATAMFENPRRRGCRRVGREPALHDGRVGFMRHHAADQGAVSEVHGRRAEIGLDQRKRATRASDALHLGDGAPRLLEVDEHTFGAYIGKGRIGIGEGIGIANLEVIRSTAAPARRLASAMKSALLSMPATRPFGATRRASRSASRPNPQPTSSTVDPGSIGSVPVP